MTDSVGFKEFTLVRSRKRPGQTITMQAEPDDPPGRQTSGGATMKAMILSVIAVVALSACGGGVGSSSSGTGGSPPGTPIPSDPRIERFESIVAGSDTLLTTGVLIAYGVTTQGSRFTDHQHVRTSCAGDQCTLSSGGTVTLADFRGATAPDFAGQISISSLGGFDAVQAEGQLTQNVTVGGSSVTVALEADSFGVWGQHGHAAVSSGSGPVSGSLLDVAFSGTYELALSSVLGDATGSNPTGTGSATWTGIAHAASTSDYRHGSGTSSVTIPDLANPTVSVAVDVSGFAIDDSRWIGIPLTAGSYRYGTQGRDFINGRFFGSDHSETYAVFETGSYVGIIAADR